MPYGDNEKIDIKIYFFNFYLNKVEKIGGEMKWEQMMQSIIQTPLISYRRSIILDGTVEWWFRVKNMKIWMENMENMKKKKKTTFLI